MHKDKNQYQFKDQFKTQDQLKYHPNSKQFYPHNSQIYYISQDDSDVQHNNQQNKMQKNYMEINQKQQFFSYQQNQTSNFDQQQQQLSQQRAIQIINILLGFNDQKTSKSYLTAIVSGKFEDAATLIKNRKAIEMQENPKFISKRLLQDLKIIANYPQSPFYNQALKVLNKYFTSRDKLPNYINENLGKRELIVSKMQVKQKKTQKFRTNILDQNSNQIIHKTDIKKRTEKNTKQYATNKFPDLNKGDNSAWHRTSLGQVQYRYEMVKNNRHLTKQDFEYLSTCLYQNNRKHQIAICDPIIFTTLKYAVMNQQAIPENFIHKFNLILLSQIFVLVYKIDKKDFQQTKNFYIHGFKEEANILTGSLLNRFSFRYPKYPKDIMMTVISIIPQIIYNIGICKQPVSKETINALLTQLKNTKEKGTLICTLNIIARYDLTIKQIWQYIFQDMNHHLTTNLPQIFTSVLEYASRKGIRKQLLDDNIKFLQIVLRNKLDKEYIKFFFGTKDTIDINSYVKQYDSIIITNYQYIKRLFEAQQQQNLNRGCLEYLTQHLNFNSNSNKDIMSTYYILTILINQTQKGVKLPEKAQKILKNQLMTVRDYHIKRKLVQCLLYNIRNGSDKLLQDTNVMNLINEVLDFGRIAAAYAINYYAEIYDSKKLDGVIEPLKLIISHTKNKQLKNAAMMAIKSVAKDNDKSVEGLENQLLINPQIIQVFLAVALKGKQTFTPLAITNISKTCIDSKLNINIRLDAALTLIYASENINQLLENNFIENLSVCLQKQNEDIVNNVLSIFDNCVKKNINYFIISKQTIRRLFKCFKNQTTSLNASATLINILQKIENKNQLLKILQQKTNQIISLIIRSQNCQIKTKQNLVFYLAIATKKGILITQLMITKLFQYINKQKNQNINIIKSLLSTIGHCEKVQQNCLSIQSLKILAHLLQSCHQDIYDSSRAIIQIYLQRNNSYLPIQIVNIISHNLELHKSKLNGSHILKISYQRNSQFSKEALYFISKAFDSNQDTETKENLIFILKDYSKTNILENRTFQNIYKLILLQDQQLVLDASQILKQSTKHGAFIPFDTFIKIIKLISNGSLIQEAKYNILSALDNSTKHLKIQEYIEIVQFLLQQTSQINLLSLIFRIFGNYFVCVAQSKHLKSNLNQKILNKIEGSFNTKQSITDGLYALNKASDLQLFPTNCTLDSIAQSLISVPSAQGRHNAFQILNKNKNSIILNQTKIIYNMEFIALQLKQNSNLQLLNKLQIELKKGVQATYTTLQVLQFYIGISDICSKILILLTIVVQNDQQLTYNIFKKLQNLLVGDLPDDIMNNAFLLIKTICKSRFSYPPELILAVEEISIKNKFHNKISLEILSIASRKNFKLRSQKFIKQILQRLGIQNKHQQRQMKQQLNNSKQKNKNQEKFHGQKNIQELITEISKSYQANNSFDCHQFLQVYNKTNEQFQQKSKFLQKKKNLVRLLVDFTIPIKDWQNKHIINWAKQMRTTYKTLNKEQADLAIIEIIAVIKRAVILDCISKNTYRQLRVTQILSLLLFIKAPTSIIAQISTGQGKSLIIALLSIIKVLQGFKVDVITSSQILAQQGVKDQKSLFDLFEISVAHNCDGKYKMRGEKQCYKQNISVNYGDASNYQFDLLRHEYSDLGTRGKRNLNETVAIIDEIDSMLIDDSSKIAMLADTMPGMSNLNVIFVVISQQLNRIACRLINQPIHYSNYIHEVRKQLLQYSIKLGQSLNDKTNKNSLFIPHHFLSFVMNQIPKWVDSAIQAKYLYKQNHHYIITKDLQGIPRITPINYSNNGQIQINTTWGDGLQQFLQTKQKIPITPQSLITNYLSNKAYLSRYGQKIYGLTGTLGSDRQKLLLKNSFKIDFVTVPRYKHRNFIENNTIIMNTKEQWISKIIQICFEALNNDRACLIICETKEQADELTTKFQYLFRINKKRGRVFAYTRDDNGQAKAVQNTLYPHDIIISTNLAGRGTDIKISKQVEEHGGLHVCVNYLPINLRVEEQAFGRTARQGHKGTAQLILNSQDLDIKYQGLQSIIDIRVKRDQIEKQKLDDFENFQLPQINKKDELFKKLCQSLIKIRQSFKYKKVQRIKSNKSIKQQIYNSQPIRQIIHNYSFQAIQQRWGLFLKLNINSQTLQKQFEQFIKNIEISYIQNNVIQNPSYYIQIGNKLIEHANSYKTRALNLLNMGANIGSVIIKPSEFFKINSQFEKWWKCKDVIYQLAQINFTKAIKLERGLAPYAAYYKRAYTHIQLQQSDYKIQALDDLKQADKILKQYLIPQISVMQLNFDATNADNGKFQSSLTEQITTNIQVMKTLSNSINNSIITIERSQKLIDIYFQQSGLLKQKLRDGQIIKLLTKQKQNKLCNVSIRLRDLKHFQDLFRDKNQVAATCQNVFKNLPSLSQVYIAFNNLTPKQAIKIIPIYKQIKQQNSVEQQKQTLQEKQRTNKKYQQGSYFDSQNLKERWKRTKNYVKQVNNQAKKWVKQTKIITKTHQLYQKGVQLTNAHQLYDKGVKLIKNGVKRGVKRIYKNFQLYKRIPVSIKLCDVTLLDTIQILINISILNTINNQKPIIQLNKHKMNIDEALNHMKQLKQQKIKTIRQDFQKQQFKTQKLYEMNQKNKQILIEKQLAQIINQIKIIQVSQQEAIDIIEIIQKANQPYLDIIYENLDKQTSICIAKKTKKFIGNSILGFKSVSASQALEIIKVAERKEQSVKIQDKKQIKDLFLTTNLPIDAINIFSAQGLDCIIELYQQQPIKVQTTCAITALGIGQIVFGALSIAVPNVGTTLISEGIGDIITAIRGVYSRNISIQDYSIQKSISLAISFAKGGFGKATDGVKAATKGVKQIRKVAIGSIDDTLFYMGVKSIGKNGQKIIMDQVFKDQLAAATKLIVVEVAESGVKQLVSYNLTQALNQGAKKIRPQIQRNVQITLQPIKEHHKIIRSITLDKYMTKKGKQTKQNQQKIVNIAKQILQTKNNRLFSSLNSIVSGILKSNQAYGQQIQIIQQVASFAQAAHKTITITENFRNQMTQSLQKLTLPNDHQLIMEELEETVKIETTLIVQKEQIIKNGYLCHETISKHLKQQFDSNFNKINKKPLIKIRSQQITKSINQNMQTIYQLHNCQHRTQIKMIYAKITKLVVAEILSILQNGITKPLITIATNKCISQISHKIQRKFNNDITVRQQIQLLQSLAQLQGKYQSGVKQLNEQNKIKYNEIYNQAIQQAQNGKGNLLHLMLMMKKLQKQGYQIELYQNGIKYDNMGKEDGKKICINLSDGHYTIMNQKNSTFQDAKCYQKGTNDCLFACLAQATGKNIQQLRGIAVKGLKENYDKYINLMPAYKNCKQNPSFFGGIWSGGGLINQIDVSGKKLKQYLKQGQNWDQLTEQQKHKYIKAYHCYLVKQCKKKGYPIENLLEDMKLYEGSTAAAYEQYCTKVHQFSYILDMDKCIKQKMKLGANFQIQDNDKKLFNGLQTMGGAGKIHIGNFVKQIVYSHDQQTGITTMKLQSQRSEDVKIQMNNTIIDQTIRSFKPSAHAQTGYIPSQYVKASVDVQYQQIRKTTNETQVIPSKILDKKNKLARMFNSSPSSYKGQHGKHSKKSIKLHQTDLNMSDDQQKMESDSKKTPPENLHN